MMLVPRSQNWFLGLRHDGSLAHIFRFFGVRNVDKDEQALLAIMNRMLCLTEQSRLLLITQMDATEQESLGKTLSMLQIVALARATAFRRVSAHDVAIDLDDLHAELQAADAADAAVDEDCFCI